MPRILILCTENSSRSQMAEGVLKTLHSDLEVFSAGISPAKSVHTFAIKVMREWGIDISAGRPKKVDEFRGLAFDYVITVCGAAEEACPAFTGQVGQHIHIGFADPAEATGSDEEILAHFRVVRDEIGARFREFFDNHLRS